MKETASILRAMWERELLAIAAVHPMREAAVRKFLQQAEESWEVVEKLIDQGQLVKTEYQGNSFYLRRPEKPNSSQII